MEQEIKEAWAFVGIMLVVMISLYAFVYFREQHEDEKWRTQLKQRYQNQGEGYVGFCRYGEGNRKFSMFYGFVPISYDEMTELNRKRECYFKKVGE